MNEIWNCWDLKPPPTCTVKMALHHKEMRQLVELVCEMSATLSNFQCLNREAAILSRLLYKNKRMFRHDKAFQNLSKIHQSLKRYLKLNLSELVKTFWTSLPKEIKVRASHAYLPTRQMLKWLLLRLLAFSQIFVRVINLAKDTGLHLYRKLHLGWQTNLSLVVYALTGRILVAAKFLVIKSVEWYNSLVKYLPYLEETLAFVPEFTFPGNLRKWLGFVDISPLKKETSLDEVFQVIDLVKDDDDLKIMSENLFKGFNPEDSGVEEVPANSAEDLGVPVRDEEKEVKLKKKQRKRKTKWMEKLKKEMEDGERKCKRKPKMVEIES